MIIKKIFMTFFFWLPSVGFSQAIKPFREQIFSEMIPSSAQAQEENSLSEQIQKTNTPYAQARKAATAEVKRSKVFKKLCPPTDGKYVCKNPAQPSNTVSLDENLKVIDYSAAPGAPFVSFTPADDALPVSKGSLTIFSEGLVSFNQATPSSRSNRYFAGPTTTIWYSPVDHVQLRFGEVGIVGQTGTSRLANAGDLIAGAKINLFDAGRFHFSTDLLFNINIGQMAEKAGLTSPSGSQPFAVASYTLTPRDTISAYVGHELTFNRTPQPSVVGVLWGRQISSRLGYFLGSDEYFGHDQDAIQPYGGVDYAIDKKSHWVIYMGLKKIFSLKKQNPNATQTSLGFSYTK